MKVYDEENYFTKREDVLKHALEVHSRRSKKDVSSDFVMSKLEGKDKDMVIQMLDNASAAKRLIERVKKHDWTLQKHMPPEFRDEKKIEKNLMQIQNMANKVFDMYLENPNAVSVLNRNKPDNYIMKLVIGDMIEQHQQEQDEEGVGKFKEWITDKLKKNE